TTRASKPAAKRPRAVRNGSSADTGALADLRAQLAALDKSQAVIQFDMNGNIQTANDNFLQLVGYRLEELQGQNHGLLVEQHYRASDEYRLFWEALRRGECQIGQYKRIAKGNREAWLQASYNPVLDAAGKPYKVLKLATDVTEVVQRKERLEDTARELESTAQQIQSAVTQTEDVVKAAIAGDLSRRIDTTDISGDMLRMAESINLLFGTVSEVFGEVQTVIRGATEGDLSGRVETGSKAGDQRRMAESVNMLL